VPSQRAAAEPSTCKQAHARRTLTPSLVAHTCKHALALLLPENIQRSSTPPHSLHVRGANSKGIQSDALQAAGGTVPDSTELLEEVVHLVEAPTVVCGSFQESFLRLPEELLVMTMRKHQRYFPVYAADTGKLTNAFVTVANGTVDEALVRRGNEDVLRARFEDASFFYDEDLKHSLEDCVPRLKGTLFHRQLGSMFDKSARESALVSPVARLLRLEDVAATAEAAAKLAKADLATAVVTEMTALAGVMGCHYARQEGQPEVRFVRYAWHSAHFWRPSVPPAFT
jgi:glycyl-tRNA synthetase beta subunit